MTGQINKVGLSSSAKQWIALISTALLVPLATGCWVQSVYPFYEDSDIVVDGSLSGVWIGDGELRACLLTITVEPGARNYTITTKVATPGSDPHDDCNSGPLRGRLLQLGQQRFVDVVPDDEKAWAPLDMILKLDSDKEHLALTPLDAEWTADVMEKKNTNLQGRIQGDTDGSFPVAWVTVTLVSPTSDLRDFLRQHADDKRAFSESGRMSFHRSGSKS